MKRKTDYVTYILKQWQPHGVPTIAEIRARFNQESAENEVAQFVAGRLDPQLRDMAVLLNRIEELESRSLIDLDAELTPADIAHIHELRAELGDDPTSANEQVCRNCNGTGVVGMRFTERGPDDLDCPECGGTGEVDGTQYCNHREDHDAGRCEICNPSRLDKFEQGYHFGFKDGLETYAKIHRRNTQLEAQLAQAIEALRPFAKVYNDVINRRKPESAFDDLSSKYLHRAADALATIEEQSK